MSEKTLSSEIKKRLPRVIASVFVIFSLYLTLNITPAFFEGIMMPVLNIGLNSIVRLVVLLIIFIFLARVLIDIRVLADKLTDPIMRQFGIKEEQSLKRVARDIAYIIIILLLAEAILPLVASIPTVGTMLGTVAGLVAFGILFIFAYDMGRTLYHLTVSRADDIADWLSESSRKIMEDKRAGE